MYVFSVCFLLVVRCSWRASFCLSHVAYQKESAQIATGCCEIGHFSGPELGPENHMHFRAL